MDFDIFGELGIVSLCIEDPITQFLRESNKQYYSIIGFFYKQNKKINFILGDVFGIHMSRYLNNTYNQDNIIKHSFYKLISNIVILDYLEKDSKKFIQKIINTISEFKPDSTRIDEYCWLSSIFGYHLPQKNPLEITPYELINQILTDKNIDDNRFRTKLVQSSMISSPKKYSYNPTQNLFRDQQILIMEKKDYITFLITLFAELMLKSPPFYQIISNLSQTKTVSIEDLIEEIRDIRTKISDNNIPVINLNKIIKIVNRISKALDLDLENSIELIKENKSSGAIISVQDNNIKNIQIKLSNQTEIIIPSYGYDLSTFNTDECQQILRVIDSKFNGESIYEKLKIDLTQQISEK